MNTDQTKKQIEACDSEIERAKLKIREANATIRLMEIRKQQLKG